MLTVEQFLVLYPDYKGANASNANLSLIQAKLAEAWLEIDPLVWGDKQDIGHGLATARKLAMTPFGKNAKLSTADGATVYDAEYRRMIRMVGGKARPLT